MNHYRNEIKYIIPIEVFLRLKNYLQSYLKLDANSNEKGYQVRSLYFDSINDNDLFDVLNGLMEKRKIRLRIYSTEDNKVKLEYKCKSLDKGTKQTLIISKNQALSMIKEDYSFLLSNNNRLAIKLYSKLKLGAYCPKVIVDYNRLAYIYIPNNVRITFDTNITASLSTKTFFDQQILGNRILPEGVGVLEVKYNEFLFGHLKKALQQLNLDATSISKYAKSRIVFNYR